MHVHPLIGMWKLVSMQRVDTAGNVSEMDVKTGMLVYTQEGWMSEGLEYSAPGTPNETSYVFYTGLFEIDGETVTHLPRIHTNHQLEWTEQPRQFEINGNRFTLTARNPNGAAYLVWERLNV